MRPNNIFLVRHGESEGNIDKNVYSHTPDWKVNLTEKGKEQAEKAAVELLSKINKKRVWIYSSPWYRARQTAAPFLEKAKASSVEVIYNEDPRIREQDWGNYQEKEVLRLLAEERNNFGTFFYRLPNGESGADVYDRISTFMETIHRDFKKADFPDNMIIYSHGITMRVFLMRWFHWSVEEFELLRNPRNCDIIHMSLKLNNKYNLVTELRKR